MAATKVTNSRPCIRRRIATDDDIEFFIGITNTSFFQSFGAAAVHVLSSSEGALDATRPASCILSRHYGSHSSSSTTISEGCVCGNTSMSALDPCRFPRLALLAAPKGEVAVSDSTTSGAAPTSPPEGVFRRTRRWKYRRAVGTHYGQTRIHPADYSPEMALRY